MPRLQTAGKKILSHLGITNEELHAFVPAVKLNRAVFWCQFDTPRSLDEIATIVERMPRISKVELKDIERFPPGKQSVVVRTVLAHVPGRYCKYMVYGMDGETYSDDGRIQLECAFAGMGTRWGSNQALHEHFKAELLPLLEATNVVERTE